MDMKEFFARADKIHSIYNGAVQADMDLYNKGFLTWYELGKRLVAYHKQEYADLRRMRKELVGK